MGAVETLDHPVLELKRFERVKLILRHGHPDELDALRSDLLHAPLHQANGSRGNVDADPLSLPSLRRDQRCPAPRERVEHNVAFVKLVEVKELLTDASELVTPDGGQLFPDVPLPKGAESRPTADELIASDRGEG